MRIGIDCLYADPGTTFGSWIYTINLLEQMSCVDENTEYFVFLSRKSAAQFPLKRRNITVVPASLSAHQWAAARVLYQNLVLPMLARAYRLDLLHSTGNFGPILPVLLSVVTVHDLLTNLNKQLLRTKASALRAAVRQLLMTLSLRKAAGVVAVSKFTQREVTALYPFVAGKIRVIYHGLPRRRTPACQELETLLQECGVSRPYLLAVGVCHPHKNIARLLEAFASVRRQLPQSYQLVLVGNTGPDNDQLRQTISRGGLPDSVLFTGVVSDDTLQALYRCADLFIFASMREGFGLPLLEAMANHIPVVCSNSGSFPEVARDAAVLFDPEDVDDMAQVICNVLADNDIRSRLVSKGTQRVEQFSFRKAAEETLELYQEVVASNR